jgi:hypothetical protein
VARGVAPGSPRRSLSCARSASSVGSPALCAAHWLRVCAGQAPSIIPHRCCFSRVATINHIDSAGRAASGAARPDSPCPAFPVSPPPLSACRLQGAPAVRGGGNLAVSPLPKITSQVSTEQPATANDRPTIQTPRPTTSDILFIYLCICHILRCPFSSVGAAAGALEGVLCYGSLSILLSFSLLSSPCALRIARAWKD